MFGKKDDPGHPEAKSEAMPAPVPERAMKPEPALRAEPAEPAAAPEKATPEDHARATGNLAARTPSIAFGTQRQRYTWQHEAAAQLHGWNAHPLNTADPLLITRAAYEGALKAVEAPVTRERDAKTGHSGDPLTAEQVAKLKDTSRLVTTYEPHTDALSPHAPKPPEQR